MTAFDSENINPLWHAKRFVQAILVNGKAILSPSYPPLYLYLQASFNGANLIISSVMTFEFNDADFCAGQETEEKVEGWENVKNI